MFFLRTNCANVTPLCDFCYIYISRCKYNLINLSLPSSLSLLCHSSVLLSFRDLFVQSALYSTHVMRLIIWCSVTLKDVSRSRVGSYQATQKKHSAYLIFHKSYLVLTLQRSRVKGIQQPQTKFWDGHNNSLWNPALDDTFFFIVALIWLLLGENKLDINLYPSHRSMLKQNPLECFYPTCIFDFLSVALWDGPHLFNIFFM